MGPFRLYLNEFTRPHIPFGIQDKKKVLEAQLRCFEHRKDNLKQNSSDRSFDLSVPTQQEHATALGVGDRKSEINPKNFVLIPLAKDHADALGVNLEQHQKNITQTLSSRTP